MIVDYRVVPIARIPQVFICRILFQHKFYSSQTFGPTRPSSDDLSDRALQVQQQMVINLECQSPPTSAPLSPAWRCPRIGQ